MRILIYYFSGTGNTAWVVQRLGAELQACGDEVAMVSCEARSGHALDPALCDMLGLAFPVHSSFAPHPFRAALQHVPSGNGCPLFVITTAGCLSGDTAWYAARELEPKGYAPFLLANVLMGNNFYIPPMDFLKVTPPEQQPRKLAKARQKITMLATWIHERQRHIEGADPIGWLLGVSQRWSHATFAKRIFPPFFADETCTRCGWCVRHCPAANITESSTGLTFGDQCCLCMRCYNFCPVQAIQATAKTRNRRKYQRYTGPEGKRHPGCQYSVS